MCTNYSCRFRFAGKLGELEQGRHFFQHKSWVKPEKHNSVYYITFALCLVGPNAFLA